MVPSVIGPRASSLCGLRLHSEDPHVPHPRAASSRRARTSRHQKATSGCTRSIRRLSDAGAHSTRRGGSFTRPRHDLGPPVWWPRRSPGTVHRIRSASGAYSWRHAPVTQLPGRKLRRSRGQRIRGNRMDRPIGLRRGLVSAQPHRPSEGYEGTSLRVPR
jgi:hypothetical protein